MKAGIDWINGRDAEIIVPRPANEVFASMQPEVGKIYRAKLIYVTRGKRGDRKGDAAVIDVKGKPVILRQYTLYPWKNEFYEIRRDHNMKRCPNPRCGEEFPAFVLMLDGEPVGCDRCAQWVDAVEVADEEEDYEL